ncbi:MAG: hypothetical protein ACOYN3_03560 [Acidimicrobiia bacterium]
MAIKSSKPATSDLTDRSRVNARARARRGRIASGHVRRSPLAPASRQTVDRAIELLDTRRAPGSPRRVHRPETSWARRVAAGTSAMFLAAMCGIVTAAIIAGSLFGIVVAILNTHR